MNRVVNATVLSRVLLDAVENGILGLDAANTILADMIIDAHYRSPVMDLGKLLE